MRLEGDAGKRRCLRLNRTVPLLFRRRRWQPDGFRGNWGVTAQAHFLYFRDVPLEPGHRDLDLQFSSEAFEVRFFVAVAILENGSNQRAFPGFPTYSCFSRTTTALNSSQPDSNAKLRGFHKEHVNAVIHQKNASVKIKTATDSKRCSTKTSTGPDRIIFTVNNHQYDYFFKRQTRNLELLHHINHALQCAAVAMHPYKSFLLPPR